jgi:hypothetical protein
VRRQVVGLALVAAVEDHVADVALPVAEGLKSKRCRMFLDTPQVGSIFCFSVECVHPGRLCQNNALIFHE